MQTVSQANATRVQRVKATPVKGSAKRRVETSIEDVEQIFRENMARVIKSLPGDVCPIQYRVEDYGSLHFFNSIFRLGDRKMCIAYSFDLNY